MDIIAGLRLTIASSEEILAWSHGEVTLPETINYLTGQPEPDGLFSERIFGPTKDWSCSCGKYKRVHTPGVTCEQCGVELTRSSVRRERMGHIDLVVPVAHPWFARGIPSIIALLLDLSPRQIGTILSYSASIVLSLDEDRRQEQIQQAHDLDEHLTNRFARLQVGDVLDDAEYRALSLSFGQVFTAQTGAAAIRALLSVLTLDDLATQLRQEVQHDAKGGKRAIKRLHLVEAFRESGVHPAWMILERIPVLPPELRPLVPLSGGRYAASDVNSLYERVIYRNNRIKQFMKMHAPEMILNHERRLLQDACDALFDNARRKHPVIGPHRQPLKSLTDTLKGKKGRFRRNLLGKRVDYSGRSVIVGDVSLQLHQCGLPTKICLELFKPFLIRKLVEWDVAPNAHVAKRMVERPRERTRNPVIWDALEEVMHEKVVLLNRAPTLHRLSIQAFEAVRMDDSLAIRLHPCVCSAFNADFDGDQMAVHLPLSDLAQAEARALLLSTRNLRTPSSGEPAISISQEMVLGLFYVTQERPSAKSAGRIFSDATEALIALDHGIIDLHTRIFVRMPDEHIFDAPGSSRPAPVRKRIETTAGRLLFNEVLPTPLRFKNYEMTKERLKQLIAESLRICGDATTAKLADALKHLGFRYATRSGISFSVLSDIAVPPEKHDLLAQADAHAQEVEEHLRAGMITSEERYQQLITIWTKTTDAISKKLEAALDPWGSLATIIKSGATKAKFQQIRQLSGIRGLMASPTGKIIAIPVRGNYLEGLKVWEIFIAASGARKGFMDRSLNTARSGYLTRRLVEAAIEVWITTVDCATQASIRITSEESQAPGLSSMHDQLLGRVLACALPEINLPRGVLLDEATVSRVIAAGITTVCVRSPLTCEAHYGLCQQCYGLDLARDRIVRLGTAVGIIAAQAVGEPGTQLTMRTFHSGGVANAQGDITQGLPRVEELFDARHPKNRALLSACDGTISIEKDEKGTHHLRLLSDEKDEEYLYDVPAGKPLLVEDHAHVRVGQALTDGPLDPQEVLQLRGREAAARYLVDEVQRVYRGTGVYIANTHIECIVRQMIRYVSIEQTGETDFLPGEIVDRFSYTATNAHILAQGGTPATARALLLGLTRTVLQTRSWLAAASFQQTSSVLTRAAIRGQWDEIQGFKERLIVGRRLPTVQGIARQTKRLFHLNEQRGHLNQ